MVEDKMFNRYLAKVVKKERANRGLTQVQLGEMAGVTMETISRLETGRHIPRLYTLCTLLDAMGLEVSFEVKEKEKINEENNTTMA